MKRTVRMSSQTRLNWLIDVGVFGGALVAVVTSIYFLYFPTGNGGQGTTFLLTRATWDDLHMWGGLVMIVAAAIHIAIHWSWVRSTSRKVWLMIRSGQGHFSRGAKVNIVVDLLVAVGFLGAAVSGIYFLFAPGGGFQGGRNPAWDPGFLFSRTTWDLIHTWSGTLMAVAALVHFYIHWGWVKKVTVNFFRTLLPVSPAPAHPDVAL